MGDDLPFVNLGTDVAALSVGAGGERTCAILDDGSLKCWGNNRGGQLGLGDVSPRGLEPSQMGDFLPAVSLGTNRTAVTLAMSALPTAAPTSEYVCLWVLVVGAVASARQSPKVLWIKCGRRQALLVSFRIVSATAPCSRPPYPMCTTTWRRG